MLVSVYEVSGSNLDGQSYSIHMLMRGIEYPVNLIQMSAKAEPDGKMNVG